MSCNVRSIFIPEKTDAEQGERYGGSGFLLSVPGGWEEPLGVDSVSDRTTMFVRPQHQPLSTWGPYREHLLGRDHIYLVTNRHVAISPKDLFARINTSSGTRIIRLPKDGWTLHPELDEIAVCPVTELSSPADQYRTIPHRLLVTEEIANELWIGPGDDVFMVGRFVNHAGIQRNLPSVRFGHIAIMPDKNERIAGEDGLHREGYLVEANSYPGYSGSPVLLFTPPWELKDLMGVDQNPRKQAADLGDRLWLLGVNWGHLPSDLDAKTSDGSTLTVRLNAGMMCVAPSWKLLEILNLPELQEQRAQESEKWKVKSESTSD